MFHKSRVLHSTSALVLVAMLLFSGIFLPATAPAALAQSGNVVFTRSAPTLVTPGSNITYEFSLQNLTGQQITNFAVLNTLPANTTYVSGGVFNAAQNRADFRFSTLANNETRTFSLVVNVSSSVAVGSFIQNQTFDYEADQAVGISISGDLVTQVEAPGQLVTRYRNAANTSFDVNVHGFGFQNYGNDGIPNPNDDLNKTDVFELFGPRACQSGNTAATCVLSAPAKSWLTKAIAGTAGGHCDGMAASSLRLFNAQPFRQYSTPASFQAGAANTINLNFPAQPIENYISHYFQTQFYVWDSHIAGSPNEVLVRMNQGFLQTPAVGYSLAIFKASNLNTFDQSTWQNGHAVVAYGSELVNANESRILVYDNNFPKQRKYITVNTAANTWRYVTASTPGQPEDAYEGTAFSQNLRLVPLSARDLPAGQYFPCPFCPVQTVASAQASAPDQFSGEIDFQFTGEGSLLIVDDQGRKTGDDLTTGTFVNEIPGTEIIHFQGGLGLDIPPLIVVPFTEHDSTFYSVFVHGRAADNATSGSLTMSGFGGPAGNGFAIGVNDLDLDPNEVFEFTISPDGDHISFTASETIVAPEIFIAHDPVHEGDPSVLFDVEGVTLLAGEKVMLDLDPLLERIHFDHTGPEAENFVVDMTLVWPDGGEQDHADTVHLPAGTTSAFIDFGAWDGLLEPALFIDNVLQNPSVNHRLKLASSSGTYYPTPQANAPAGVYHVDATFTNVTEVSLADVYFSVANLGAGNVLLNADGSPAGAGAKVSVPAAALGADGILHSNESFTFGFDVGLASAGSSNLTVDANGVPHDWIHPDPAPSYDANNASFVFALAATPPVKVNSQIALKGIKITTLTTTPDATYPAQSTKGVAAFNLKLENKDKALRNVSFRVKTLTGNNYLLNADGGPGQVGSKLSLPNSALPSGNQLWDKNEQLTQDFRIGLMSRNIFLLLVDVYASKTLVTAADATGSAETEELIDSYLVEVDPEGAVSPDNMIYLPVVAN